MHVLIGCCCVCCDDIQSVLEHMHCSTAFKILQQEENDFLCNLSKADKKRFRETVIKMVLATDMGRHRGHVKEVPTVGVWGVFAFLFSPSRWKLFATTSKSVCLSLWYLFREIMWIFYVSFAARSEMTQLVSRSSKL